AAQHPLGLHAVRGMQRYMDFMCNGWTGGLHDFWEEGFLQVKPMYAKLINAKRSEIALTGSTTIGENTLLNGMDFGGGNVVTNDLHYTESLSDYLTRQKLGLDVRIVKNRDWDIDLGDMERAVDGKTKLIAVSLVSSVNGHLENAKALSDLAHAHGAYLYTDIIQGCGAIPIDVRAMGIDMASCAMYKWLMGEHGFGFLYVREELIGPVVKGTLHEGHPDFNYRPWAKHPSQGAPDFVNHPSKGVGTIECGTPSVITYAAQYESFQYIENLGIANIRSHVRPLVNRLRKELPPLGYTCITPAGTETPIITFISHDIEATRNKIREANRTGRAKISITGPNSALTVGRFGNHVRFSVSVYNNDQDVDKILEVLS
ncbi:MAG TPA: aminotransferase class V-fold PLP-dependent enzyme, partial [Bryobacterales bacterium]|nr:aminotransferase class V-fold PLP-dependent enzyme [Bryobacterales bacterium]